MICPVRFWWGSLSSPSLISSHNSFYGPPPRIFPVFPSLKSFNRSLLNKSFFFFPPPPIFFSQLPPLSSWDVDRRLSLIFRRAFHSLFSKPSQDNRFSFSPGGSARSFWPPSRLLRDPCTAWASYDPLPNRTPSLFSSFFARSSIPP